MYFKFVVKGFILNYVFVFNCIVWFIGDRIIFIFGLVVVLLIGKILFWVVKFLNIKIIREEWYNINNNIIRKIKLEEGILFKFDVFILEIDNVILENSGIY